MKNKVKSLRTKLGLTQRQLAASAGTSQQQIQRIESGAISTRLELATKISQALGQPVESVFPGMVRTIKKLVQEMEGSKSLPSDDQLRELNEQGIEGDPRLWTLKVLLKGQGEPLLFPISAEDKRRFTFWYQKSSGEDRFFVFDSSQRRIALNLQETLFCHLLFDPSFGQPHEDASPHDEDGTDSRVAITFVGGVTHEFAADPDEPDEDGYGQLGDIYFRFEHMEAYDVARFVDLDGEEVWFRLADVAMFEVSLSLLEGDGEEDEDEDE